MQCADGAKPNHGNTISCSQRPASILEHLMQPAKLQNYRVLPTPFLCSTLEMPKCILCTVDLAALPDTMIRAGGSRLNSLNPCAELLLHPSVGRILDAYKKRP